MMLASSPGIGTGVPTLLDAVETPAQLEEFAHYRRQMTLSHRLLEPIARYGEKPAAAVSRESLLAWRSSGEFRAAEAMFADYPERSLCRTIDRMLLYHLVRTLRPEHVVEVGTYFAAGSEVLSRALWENGTGLLHTIDPYGRIRGPSLIGRWDERLKEHIRFYPWNSMEFFQHLGERGIAPELVFIDGNHDFEFALFDLEAAARLMKPGGVIIMDDCNQSGPLWASKVFLEQHPGWEEIGACLAVTESQDPFGPVPTLFPDSKFLMLHSAPEVLVGRLPHSTGQVPFDGRQLDGIRFAFAGGQRGALPGRVFLRGFPVGERPELLHQIQCQRGAAGSQRVQKADLRIEASGFNRGSTVVHQHRIEKGQQCIHAVTRRTTGAPVHGKLLARTRTHYRIQAGEILPSGFTLDAAQAVETRDLGQRPKRCSQVGRTAFQPRRLLRLLGLARTAQNHLTCILDLSRHARTRRFESKRRVVRALVLRAPQQDVAGHRPFQPSLETTILIEQHEADTPIGQTMHERSRHAHVAHANHAADVMEWNAQANLALDVDADRLVLQLEIAFRRGDVKGIQNLQRASPRSRIAVAFARPALRVP
jgi:hypothetical protein